MRSEESFALSSVLYVQVLLEECSCVAEGGAEGRGRRGGNRQGRLTALSCLQSPCPCPPPVAS